MLPTLTVDLDPSQIAALNRAILLLPKSDLNPKARESVSQTLEKAVEDGNLGFFPGQRNLWFKRMEHLSGVFLQEAKTNATSEKRTLQKEARVLDALGERVAHTSLILDTDLTAITRDTDLVKTTVSIQGDQYEEGYGSEMEYEPYTSWLTLGATSLRMDLGTKRLEARMPLGVTDVEHDSAYALILPLVDVSFERVVNGFTCVSAIIAPRALEDFKVPWPGYDPTQHPEACICTWGACEKNPHIVVPEDFYTPYSDPHLYNHVQGRRVSIRFGPVRKAE